MRRIAFPIAVAVLVATGLLFWRSRPPEPQPEPEMSLGQVPRLLWTFSAPRPGAAVATPSIADDAIYFAAIHSRGFKLEGAVYALDPTNGKRKWTFDPDDAMLPTASAPLLEQGRLYLGEGMHANFSCKLYCLDAVRGTPLWTFKTTDHIEGGPVRLGDRVLFPAGNDGVYCLEAATGKKLWNFRADLHIDSTPAIVEDRVYVGSGPSRKNPASEIVCLNAANGQPVWRAPLFLPAWAPLVVEGNRVYAGLGNGRLTEAASPPETPAGALACLDARHGEILWTFPVGDAVFGRPALAADRIFVGSRDGNLYAVSFEGRERFRAPAGGPVMAPPLLANNSLFAVSTRGRILCLDPADGRERWRFELTGSGEPHVYAAPVVRGNRLYLAYETRSPGAAVGVVSLSCFELPSQDTR